MTSFEVHHIAAQNQLTVERALVFGSDIERDIDIRLFEIALVGEIELGGFDKSALLAQFEAKLEILERGKHKAIENSYSAVAEREINLLIAFDDFIIVRVWRAVAAKNAVESEV